MFRRIAGVSTVLVVVLTIIVSAPAHSQAVLLRINPRLGDTLAVWMNQKVEMTGMPVECARAEVCAEDTRSMTTVMEVFSRAIIRRKTSEGAVVLAVTDSIRTSTSPGNRKPTSPSRVRGRDDTIDLRVSADGSVEVVDEDASDELRALFGQMPATLSGKPVSVGDRWTRQMRIPIAGRSQTSGVVSATFSLDSLGRSGEMAYISMRGTLSHDQRSGGDSDFAGSMSGAIQLDRRLGWISETRAVIDVTSVVQPASGGRPMRVRTRVTQLLRASSAR